MRVRAMSAMVVVLCSVALAVVVQPAWAKDTRLFATGENANGQLGLGDTEDRSVFTMLPGLTSVTAIGAGGAHSLVVAGENELYVAGTNELGQIGLGGTGSASVFTVIPDVSDVTAVAGGGYHSLTTDTDSALWGAGRNVDGALGFDDSGYHREFDECPTISGVSAFAGGGHFSVAVKDSNLWATGENGMGQLGTGNNTNRHGFVQITASSDVTAVGAGWAHSLMRKSNGTVWATGSNIYGQLGLGDNTSHNTFVQATGISDVIGIAAATNGTHSLAIKSDGSLWVTGYNESGQLGLGDLDSRTAFTQVPGLDNVAAIAAGNDFSLALKSDGTLWAAGRGGECGLGKAQDFYSFTQVRGLVAVTAIAAGQDHALAIASYGVEVTYPSASGITLERGKTVLVAWDSFNLPKGAAAKIELVKGSGEGPWTLSARATKSPFKWTVGKEIKGASMYDDGTDYKIRVSLLDGSDSDESDNDFAIGSVDSLEVTGDSPIIGGAAPEQYTCTANYSTGGDRDVTNEVKWSCLPTTYAKMGKTGLLTTKAVPSDQGCTITAAYGKGKPPVTGDLVISIQR